MADENEGSGGGLFGRLKGAIFEDSAEDTEAADRPKPAPAQRSAAPAVPPTGHRVAQAGTTDPKIRAVLQRPVDEAAKPAYTAFQATMTNLSTVIPDEATRIKAAIATLPQGLSLAQLVTDIDECLAAIAQKEGEATATAQRKRQEQVGRLEQELQGADGGIAQKREQIATLQREIAQLEATRSRLQGEIRTAGSGIDETLAAIAATAAEMRTELTGIRAKIKQQQTGG